MFPVTRLEKVGVAISRTQPAYNGNPEIREVEALYLDAIAAAQHSIYIEAQYFTSTAIADALAKRLTEPGGPEVLLLLPRDGAGWLEQNTMTVLRARLLRRLCAADRFGCLRVYYPAVECPLAPERLIEPYIPQDNRRLGGRRLMRSAIFLVVLVALAAGGGGLPWGVGLMSRCL